MCSLGMAFLPVGRDRLGETPTPCFKLFRSGKCTFELESVFAFFWNLFRDRLNAELTCFNQCTGLVDADWIAGIHWAMDSWRRLL
jgi:hypothetical protein